MTHYTNTMNNGNRNDCNDTNSATPPLFTFSTNLFMIDPTAEPTVSQPFQAVFSSVRPAVQHGVKRETPSPPMGMERRQGSALAASPTSMSQRSIYSPRDGYLDPAAPAATPAGINLGGYSGGTTPGFDTLEELPDFNRVDTLLDEERMSIASDAGSSVEREHQLFPSPRLSISPTSHPASQTSPIVKIEDHTLTGQNHQLPQHPHTPISRNSSSSNPTSPHPQPTPDDNGKWHSHSRCGLSPEARDDTYLPLSLEEQEIQRLKLAKSKEIEQWLRGSMLVLPLGEVSRNDSGRSGESGRKLKTPRLGGHRRAQSATDSRCHDVQTQMERDQSNVQQGTGTVMSTGNPGIVNDESEDDNDDDDDDDASVPIGWRESSLPSSDTLSDYQAELPASASGFCAESDKEHERLSSDHDPTLEPRAHQFFSRPPWIDIAPAIYHGATSSMRTHPATAMSAMQKLEQCSRNIETASRVATFGSQMRRNSTGDAEGVGVMLERFSFGKNKNPASHNGGGSRGPSFWDGFQKSLKRTLSSIETDSSSTSSTVKPKDNHNLPTPAPPLLKGHEKRGSSFGGSSSTSLPFAPSRLGTGFGVPSLKLDTTIKQSHTSTIGGAFVQMTSPLMAPGAGSGSHSALPTSPKPTSPNQPKQSTNTLMGHLTRSKSKSRNRSGSDLQRKHVFGVVTSLIGPALPSGVSPVSPRAKRWGGNEWERGRQEMLSPVSAERRGFDVDGDGDDVAMADNNINDEEESISPQQQLPSHQPHNNQKTQHDTPIPASYPTPTIIPTFDGFTEHILSLCPHLLPELVERFANEQCKRFRKLVDHRQKHLKALDEKGMCDNGEGLCRKVRGQEGVGGEGSVSVLAGRRGGGNTGNKEEVEGEEVYDSDHLQHASISHVPTTTTATFPPLIPSPPTSYLPSTFECPICFKLKSITKPSDWTKHVHEDLQPFTCTFPDCNEPKSFKRKADWVRHENERHRQLEWWVCQEGGCGHRCYRRDNFLQHLVREHKYTETNRKSSAGRGGSMGKEELWRKIDACHHTTTQDPQTEKCRFCGATCPSFKKLTVHLAKHMEGIALPVLGLITDVARSQVGLPKRRGRVGAQAQARVHHHQQQQIQHQQQATAMRTAAKEQVSISPATRQTHPHSQASQQMPTIPAVSTTIAVSAAMGPTQMPTPTPTSTGLTPITPVSVNMSIPNPGVYQPSPTAAMGVEYHPHQHQHHPNLNPSASLQQQYQPVDYWQLQQQITQQCDPHLQQQRYDRLPQPPHTGHHRSPSAPDLPTFGMRGRVFQLSPPRLPQTYLHHRQQQHHPQQHGMGMNMNMDLYQFPNPSQRSQQMQQMEETQMVAVDSGMGVDVMEEMDGVDGIEEVEQMPLGMGMGVMGGMGEMVYTGLQVQGTREW